MQQVQHPHERDYPTLARDTDPAAEAVQFRILAQMSPSQKLQLVDQAIRNANAATRMGLRARHPHASEEELHWRFMALLHGEDVAVKALGPMP